MRRHFQGAGSGHIKHDSTADRLRITVGLLSLASGVLYAAQITPAYRALYALGLLVIVIALLQLAFGTALLVRPWMTDSIGRRKPAAVAHRSAHYWFLAGLTGKLIVIVLVAGYLAGAVDHFGTRAFAVAVFVLDIVAVMCLTSLLRTQRRRMQRG